MKHKIIAPLALALALLCANASSARADDWSLDFSGMKLIPLAIGSIAAGGAGIVHPLLLAFDHDDVSGARLAGSYIIGALNVGFGAAWMVIGAGSEQSTQLLAVGIAQAAVGVVNLIITAWVHGKQGSDRRRVTLAPTLARDSAGGLAPGVGVSITTF